VKATAASAAVALLHPWKNCCLTFSERMPLMRNNLTNPENKRKKDLSCSLSPENSRLPHNELGTRTAAYSYFKGDFDFDHPEQRPGVERCIESWGSPPLRAFIYQLFHGIVQTPDQIATVSEESIPLRVIHMDGGTELIQVSEPQGHSHHCSFQPE